MAMTMAFQNLNKTPPLASNYAMLCIELKSGSQISNEIKLTYSNNF